MNKKRPSIPPLLQFNWYPPGPVCERFVASDALVCGIRGPFGSGKSVACIAKLLRNFTQQKPGPDGVVRRRTAIVRNTYGELSTTTIKTWHAWIPRTVGHFIERAPPTHTIIANDSSGRPVVEWEVLFLALDRPPDVAKLLSMDLSDAWINEARELPKAVLDGLTGRVGRYPQTVRNAEGKVTHGCAAPQIVMDTNPPDTDHWWAKMADFADPETLDKNREIAELLHNLGTLRTDQKLDEFFSQPSGRGQLGAENIGNLPAGYYERLMADKSAEWIKVYVDGDYGFVQEGKAVYPEYRDSTHCREFVLNRHLPMYVGIDFGLTPAAVFGQRTPMGAWRIHSEFVTEDMGALRFGQMLGQIMRERYAGMTFAAITGDPAGEGRAQTDETTPFEMLRVSGIVAYPAPTNDYSKRRETFAFFLNRMIEGDPGMLVHPKCQRLRKALAGAYHYRRMAIVGEERYHDQPVKDMASHVAEAGQYLLLGAGEARTVLRASPELRNRRAAFADFETNPFAR
jgi:hypothetical protein